jgi:hypothetical protein
MNATKRERWELSAADYAEVQEAADRAIRKRVPGMPKDQREDYVQETITRAIEGLPPGSVEDLKAEVRRRASSIAGNETRREKRQQAIRDRDPSLAPASGGTPLEGVALREAAKDRAWRELRQWCPGLDRASVDRALAYGSEFEGTADDDERELDAFELHLDLARALGAAVEFVHNLNPPAEGHPQIERLVRVARELCGEVRFVDLPDGGVQPMCENPTAEGLLTYRPGRDLDRPSPGCGTDVRRGAVLRWILAEGRGDVPPLRTNRQFAYVTVLAGAWPEKVTEPATVDDVIAAELEAVKKMRQRADITKRRLEEDDRLDQESFETFGLSNGTET